jgi:hypothetical protein
MSNLGPVANADGRFKVEMRDFDHRDRQFGSVSPSPLRPLYRIFRA